MSDSTRRMIAACNRLAKWRAWFAGWQLGTQPTSHGPTRALRDAAEARLLMRAELTAMSSVLLTKGLITEDEYREAIAREADFLSEALSEQFPGVEATEAGLTMDARVVETMRREGFPP